MILAWTSAHSHLGQPLLELVVADDATGQLAHVTVDPGKVSIDLGRPPSERTGFGRELRRPGRLCPATRTVTRKWGGTSYKLRSLGRVISGARISPTGISVRNWTVAAAAHPEADMHRCWRWAVRSAARPWADRAGGGEDRVGQRSFSRSPDWRERYMCAAACPETRRQLAAGPADPRRPPAQSPGRPPRVYTCGSGRPRPTPGRYPGLGSLA